MSLRCPKRCACWRAFYFFAHTDTISTSNPQQCEIKEWNIYRHSLEDSGGWCSVGSCTGWRLARGRWAQFYLSLYIFFFFLSKEFPRAPVPAAPRQLWRSPASTSACDVRATRAFGSLRRWRWKALRQTTVCRLNYKSILHNMQLAEWRRRGLVTWCSKMCFFFLQCCSTD